MELSSTPSRNSKEARFWFCAIVGLFILLLFAAYYRFGGLGKPTPKSIVKAQPLSQETLRQINAETEADVEPIDPSKSEAQTQQEQEVVKAPSFRSIKQVALADQPPSASFLKDTSKSNALGSRPHSASDAQSKPLVVSGGGRFTIRKPDEFERNESNTLSVPQSPKFDPPPSALPRVSELESDSADLSQNVIESPRNRQESGITTSSAPPSLTENQPIRKPAAFVENSLRPESVNAPSAAKQNELRSVVTLDIGNDQSHDEQLVNSGLNLDTPDKGEGMVRESIPKRATLANSSLVDTIPKPNKELESNSKTSPTQSWDRSDAALAKAGFEFPPEQGSKRSYSVIARTGDTYWSIAQRTYDEGRLFRALHAFNRRYLGDNPELEAGALVKTPPLEILIKQFSELVPKDLTQDANSSRIDNE